MGVALAAPGGTVNLFGGCARDSTFTVPTARVHYDEVTLTATYHHAPRYLARALQIFVAGIAIAPALASVHSLAGRLAEHPPAKYTVLPGRTSTAH